MTNTITKWAGALALCASAVSAGAHVPFLKPNQFNVEHDRLQIESSFTEMPFQADFAMDSPHFSVVAPDGSRTAITPVARTRAAVYLAPVLQQEGTYRFSTGVRVGPQYKAVETATSKLYFSGDMKRVVGTPVSMQYYSRADVYVHKGDTRYTPRPFNEGAEIVPLSAPGDLMLGRTLRLQVLMDGRPVPKARIVVVADNEHFRKNRRGDFYDVENARASNITTDEQGQFDFSPQLAGLNLLFVTLHHKTGANAWDSHNASLVL